MMKKVLNLISLILLIYIFVFFAVKYGWTNEAGVVDDINNLASVSSQMKPDWMNSEEWHTLSSALWKDEEMIKRAAQAAEISPRLLITIIIPEQMRLFHDEREIFKQIFAPLKILGNQTQFSWGIAGLKPDTAEKIEENLRDRTSPFYPGEKYANLLDFQTTNQDDERFSRIADEHDHYYSYLYTALYAREVISQWHRAGFDISNRPEIIATLFNIGFANSQPKPEPLSGGAEINLAGRSASFGRLAYEFYYSGELLPEFPLTSSRPSSSGE